MTELTLRQQQITDFIDRTRRDRDVAPSYREIASHFGFSPLSS
jgi:SOS-response transcriptional repressor LexA